ncbi:hypothetical protein [Paraburkholderia fungorum]|uniref:hypothetical protein n=1 Tax=Paraburkholderia fungorum TaxID=134537 RepID=UPI001C1F020E|nr:hypothetical protein [Paraburkholderia fungorum]MBU7442308.1 hypothetical protein [Paraburkholderia fungorum]
MTRLPDRPGRHCDDAPARRALYNRPRYQQREHVPAFQVGTGKAFHLTLRRLTGCARDRPGEPLIIILAEAGQAIDAGWRLKAIPLGLLLIASSPGFVALSHVLGARQRHRMYAESEPKLLARTTGLTGFNLCRMLKENFDEERCRSRRTRSMFSLLFVNIDRSVAYDDIYCLLAIHERCSARRPEGISRAAAGHPSAGAV